MVAREPRFIQSAIGVYSLNSNVSEIVIMLVFGILGFFLHRAGFEGAPFILAVVLGPIMETSLRQSLLISRGSFGIFATRPICAALMGFTLLFMLWPMIWKRKTEGKDRSPSAQESSSS